MVDIKKTPGMLSPFKLAPPSRKSSLPYLPTLLIVLLLVIATFVTTDRSLRGSEEELKLRRRVVQNETPQARNAPMKAAVEDNTSFIISNYTPDSSVDEGQEEGQESDDRSNVARVEKQNGEVPDPTLNLQGTLSQEEGSLDLSNTASYDEKQRGEDHDLDQISATTSPIRPPIHSKFVEDSTSDKKEEAMVFNKSSRALSQEEGSLDLSHTASYDEKQGGHSTPAEKEEARVFNKSDTSTSQVPVVENSSVGEGVSLREQLRLRSLQAKELIAQKLKEAISPAQDPPYIHYHGPKLTQMESTNRSCHQEDAFSGIPIDGWVPPGGTNLESIQRWDRAYKDSLRKIKETTSGGSELRDFAKNEVHHLRELRHELFCGR